MISIDSIIFRAYDLSCIISHGTARDVLRIMLNIKAPSYVEDKELEGSQELWDQVDTEILKRSKR
jgi:hypothetical protein